MESLMIHCLRRTYLSGNAVDGIHFVRKFFRYEKRSTCGNEHFSDFSIRPDSGYKIINTIPNENKG